MSGRILVVDDDDGARISLAALLEDEGHSVVEASSEDELKATLAEAPQFDLVLLDLHLGDVLGTDFAPDVRAHSPRARILVLSGEEARREKGIDGWLLKGEDTHRTLAAIAEQLRAATR